MPATVCGGRAAGGSALTRGLERTVRCVRPVRRVRPLRAPRSTLAGAATGAERASGVAYPSGADTETLAMRGAPPRRIPHFAATSRESTDLDQRNPYTSHSSPTAFIHFLVKAYAQRNLSVNVAENGLALEKTTQIGIGRRLITETIQFTIPML